jgi:hypothetical protein
MARPGIVDSPELRKAREVMNTKLNSIDMNDKQSLNIQPLKITHQDVVMGSNSVYGSQFAGGNSGGGIIFAITGQSTSAAAPLMSPGLFCNHSRY